MNAGIPPSDLVLTQAPEGVLNDCWNRIGVRGDGSCRLLARHVHCRNCEIYSHAASTLLDADLPAGHLAEWTRHFATAAVAPHTGSESMLVFRVEAEWLALPTALFKEVTGPRPIHSLPHRRADDVVLGVVNVRGELLVCVSLGRLLGIEGGAAPAQQKGRTRYERLLVVQHEQNRLVFPASEVFGVHRFEECREVPATVAKATASFTRALASWEQKTVALLDAPLLFHSVNRTLR